jgi:anti-sigma factor ChrR (cupin superfamily)
MAPGEQPPGGLTCSEVEHLVDAYAKGTLDEETRLKVRQHVTQCPLCGPRFNAMGLKV